MYFLLFDSVAVREFANKSAASAASRDYVKFQAVIKSAASAASPKAKSREGSSEPDDGSDSDDGTGLGRRIGRSPVPGFPGFGRLR